MAAIGSLASGVAHQISNPLTTIIAEAQLLRRTPDEGCRESAQAIEQAGWRAQAAVQRLIELSQPAALEPELVSINQTIENALSLAGAHVEAMGVRVELKLDPGDPRVRGNPRQLEDLWNILLTQAHEAAVDNTQHCITVSSARGAAGEVVVRVHDDGRVIPPERQLALFEPGTDRGSGYELSICREIVRQHGGGITVESTPLYGTTLTVSFRPEVSPCPTP
jgi:signal transduction histidine kinase